MALALRSFSREGRGFRMTTAFGEVSATGWRLRSGGTRVLRGKLGGVCGRKGWPSDARDGALLQLTDTALEKFFEGGGFAVGDAAGNDEVEVTQIGGDVVGKTVGGDPAADVDANGGEFFFRWRRRCTQMPVLPGTR